ncbi:hypothetical protein ACIRJM_21955 [Streptomyces sp. NPDC102405]|uniref:hypothetical protein n=1 Tax=Streptomyces sp. NPDC102405 TaxID=3366170 RepID=UPI00380A0B67
MAAVDARMEPWDRTAALLMTKVSAIWWGEVKPTLDAYENDDRDLMTATWQEIDARHVVGRLVDRWRKAWVPVRNRNGYMDPPGVMWLAIKGVARPPRGRPARRPRPRRPGLLR